MKHLQSFIGLAAAALTMAACQSNSYRISGTASELAEGDTLFFTTDLQNGIPSDTIVVHDGKFQLSGETDTTQLAIVYSAANNEQNALFFVEAGTINVQLSATPGGARVGGTKVNNEWQRLNDSVMVVGLEINRIAEHIYGEQATEAEQKAGMEKIDKLNQRFSAIVKSAAERNIDNELGYFILTTYPEEVISTEDRLALIDKLPEKMRQREEIKQMKEFFSKTNAETNGYIEDFAQPTLSGELLNISTEIEKNDITVIDFWASWCAPCRAEMPKMKELYQKYHAQGLGIVGISLDSKHDAWKNATEELGIPWPQMSDLKGWDNAAAQAYGVTSIPHTIVVDRSGKILRSGLRGAELESFVTEQLKPQQ